MTDWRKRWGWRPWIVNRENAFTLMQAAYDSLRVHGRKVEANEMRRRVLSSKEALTPAKMRAIIKEYVSVCKERSSHED